jgi:hypothetical protein
MSTFFFLIGFGLLIKAVWTYYSLNRWLAKSRTTTGTVNDYATGTFLMGNANFAIVQFTVNGKPVVFRDKWPAGYGSGQIGQNIPVWYNPQNPVDALVNANVIRWSLPAAWLLPTFLLLMMSYTTQGL